MVNKAVVLAAGCGKRLKPISDHIPKPLFPIANEPSIGLIVNRLKSFGVKSFYFNLFHLADKIDRFLAGQNEFEKTIEFERVLRDTGGGISNFQDDLQDECFIVFNSDVYTEEDLGKIIDSHVEAGALVTMMVADYPEINSITVDSGRILFLQSDSGNYTYCGVAVFSPEIWNYMPAEMTFSIVPVIQKAINHGENVQAFISEKYWSDFGTLPKYLELHRYLHSLKKNAIDSTTVLEGNELQGFNFIGEKSLVTNCRLENCVVFPNSQLVDRSLKNCVVYPQGIVEL